MWQTLAAYPMPIISFLVNEHWVLRPSGRLHFPVPLAHSGVVKDTLKEVTGYGLW